VKSPKLLKTVSAQITDLNYVEKSTISTEDSIKEALDLMTKENFSSLPVIDTEGYFKTMLSISDIANTYLEIDYSDLFSKYSTTFENLKEALDSYTISRDYTQYRINGQGTYSKNALVKEIVTRIIKKGGDVMGTLKNLDAKCTIRLLQTEEHYNREKKQAFKLEYNDSFIYITNQWRIGNISSFIDAVNEDNTIGLLIEPINK